MNDKRRELILRVADGENRNFPILHQIDNFVHSEKMFIWMIQNGITGKNLFELYTIEFMNSWLSLGKWVIMMINKDTQIRKVIAGKDFIVK